MSTSISVQDQLDIHHLLARAACALDEHAMDRLTAVFTQDASFSMRIAGGDLLGPFEGRQAIMDMMAGAVATQSDQRRHVVSNIYFGATGDAWAEVNSNLTLLATEEGVLRVLSAGVYQDRVVATTDGWLLQRRHLELDKSY